MTNRGGGEDDSGDPPAFPPSRGEALALDAPLLSPKIRSLAAWYCASRSAKLFCCSASEAADGGGEALVDADGRFRMRSEGWKAAGGGGMAEDVALCAEINSSGMGAFLFLCDVPRRKSQTEKEPC